MKPTKYNFQFKHTGCLEADAAVIFIEESLAIHKGYYYGIQDGRIICRSWRDDKVPEVSVMEAIKLLKGTPKLVGLPPEEILCDLTSGSITLNIPQVTNETLIKGLLNTYLIIRRWHDETFLEKTKNIQAMEESWEKYKESKEMKPVTELMSAIKLFEERP